MSGRVLVARMDNLGDVLLAGPCVRAVAAHSDHVTLLTGPRGRDAGELLPGVDDVITWCAPWIDPEPPPVTGEHVGDLVQRIREQAPDKALILTSFHQSPLPLALLLRLAGVPWIGAISEDYPGSLLDLRHHTPEDLPEPLRMLSLAEAAGFPLPEDDHGRLAVKQPLPNVRDLTGDGPYVVVHPAASVPARQPSTSHSARIVQALAEQTRVLVTGADTDQTAEVAGGVAVDLGGRTDLPRLAAVLANAEVVVVPNTGPAHLAAAVGTPVVSLFAPVVPAARWAPFGVPTVVLGDQNAACRDSRARTCPVPGHPCLDGIDPAEVSIAVTNLTRKPLRVLLWHVHGSWADAFVRGSHQYFMPVNPGLGKAGRDWPSVTEVPGDRLAEVEPDVVVLQRPEELEPFERLFPNVPAVYVEHNAPRGHAADTRHVLADRSDIPIVHVTHFNAVMWDSGLAPHVVIPHGIPDPGPRYTGELAAGAAMVNEPVRRSRVVGTDLLTALAKVAPVDVFGMGTEELGPHGRGDLPAPTLHDEVARRRVYLHTARWTSLGLSLLEAMHLAMPVVVLASTEAAQAVPPEAGVVATDFAALARGFHELVNEPDYATLAGRSAREHALRHHGLDAFLMAWDRQLKELS